MIKKLVLLRQRLEHALNDKEYHLLMSLDQEIKDSVQKSVSLLKDESSDKALGQQGASNTLQLKNELEKLMELYKKVVDSCEERSSELKGECISLKNTKQGAVKYLDVASQL